MINNYIKKLENINLSKNIKIGVILILIFLIIFYNEIIIENKNYSKILFYSIYIIFILNLFIFKNEPGIILLYSSLFTLLWYKYNFKK